MRPNNFDLLRLMAALQVVYCHTTFHLGIDSGLGHPALRYLINWFPGVPIFFTISGFLISRSWERSSGWFTYAENRLLRIYPALWLQLAIGILLLLCVGAITPTTVTNPSFYSWLVAQSTFAQFYSAPFIREFGWRSMNGSLWTIPVELGFYVVLPILYLTLIDRLHRTWSNLAIIMIAFMSFAYWFQLSHLPEPHEIGIKLQLSTPLPHLHMFLIGVLFQRNLETLWPWLENRALWWLATFGLCMLTLNPWGEGSLAASPLAVLVGRLLLAATVLSVALTCRSLSETLLRGNDLSYGVYLYHGLMLHVCNLWDLKRSSWDLVLVTLASLGLAMLSWQLIEFPALSTKRKRNAFDRAPIEVETLSFSGVGTSLQERRAA